MVNGGWAVDRGIVRLTGVGKLCQGTRKTRPESPFLALPGLTLLCKRRKGFCFGMPLGAGTGVRGLGNTSVRDLLSDKRFTGAVLRFLRSNVTEKVKEGILFF